MKIIMRIIGILMIAFNGLYILFGVSMLGMGNSYGVSVSPIILIIFVIPLIIGIVLVKKSKNK